MRNLLLISAIAAIPLGLGALDLLKVGASDAVEEVASADEPYEFPDIFGDGSSIDVNGVPFPVPEDWEGCVSAKYTKLGRTIHKGNGELIYSPLSKANKDRINYLHLSGEAEISLCEFS